MPGSQVSRRWAMVVLAFAYVGVLGVLAFGVRTQTSESSFGSTSPDPAHSSTLTITTEQTLWQTQGLPVAVILGVLAAVCVVGAASLAWRVAHRSPRAGRSALVAAGLLGVLALLGLLSIGVFLVPVVVLVAWVGLPLADLAEAPAP